MASARAPRLYVGGVPKQANKEEFKEYFEAFGEVKDLILMGVDRDVPHHRGFGFIQYVSKEVAETVLGQESHILKGAAMGVKIAKQKGTRLFLGGLKNNITEEALREHFEAEVDVADLNIFKERGFGFVTIQGSGKKLNEILGQKHEIDGVHIRVTVAEPKREDGGRGGPRGRGGYGRGGYGGRGGYDDRERDYHRDPPSRGGYGGGYGSQFSPYGGNGGGYGGYGGGYAPSSGYGSGYQNSNYSYGGQGYQNHQSGGGAYGSGAYAAAPPQDPYAPSYGAAPVQNQDQSYNNQPSSNANQHYEPY